MGINDISYNVDDYGNLKVYKGYSNIILFEIRDCKDMSEKDIVFLIEDELAKKDNKI